MRSARRGLPHGEFNVSLGRAGEESKEWTDPVAEELSKIMKGRQRLPYLAFFAFTATPKTKTLEVFGNGLFPAAGESAL